MGVLLPARGFNSVDNILEMDLLGVPYITQLRGSDRLNDVMGDVDAGGDAVSEYVRAGGWLGARSQCSGSWLRRIYAQTSSVRI